MIRIKNENTGWKTKIYIRESIMKLRKYLKRNSSLELIFAPNLILKLCAVREHAKTNTIYFFKAYVILFLVAFIFQNFFIIICMPRKKYRSLSVKINTNNFKTIGWCTKTSTFKAIKQ